MAVHVALLRGINVGGNKKVSMPLLKNLFETMGFRDVRTYINSGNVIFSADDAEPSEALTGRIEAEINRTFGFPVDVVLRSADDMARAAAANPFAEEGTPEALHLHVGFLRTLPTPDRLEKLQPYVTDDDRFRLVGTELYVMFRAGVRDSKLGNNVAKIGVPVTLRNWNTTCKLAEMANGSA